MAYKIKVTQKGSAKKMLNDIKKNIAYVEVATNTFGDRAVNYMANIITTSTKRQPSTGKLANAIKKYTTAGDMFEMGIGRVGDLPEYWHVVNYGMTMSGEPFIPGRGQKVRGSFGWARPDSAYAGVAGGEGVRYKTGKGFAVQAKSVIEPMNYLEKTWTWFDMEWPNYIKSKMRKRNR